LSIYRSPGRTITAVSAVYYWFQYSISDIARCGIFG